MMRRSRLLGALAGFLVAGGVAVLIAQGVRMMSGDSSDLLEINANKAAAVVAGKSDLQSYIASTSQVVITAAGALLSLEAEAARGFRVTKICITPGAATAALVAQWQLIRTTAASSGGTAITAEITTGNNGLAKMDPADSNWGGIARTVGTGGTSGAIVDSGNIHVAIAATPPTTVNGFTCKEYGLVDGKQLVVAAGVTNGVKIQFEGSAGGIDAGASIHFVAN